MTAWCSVGRSSASGAALLWAKSVSGVKRHAGTAVSRTTNDRNYQVLPGNREPRIDAEIGLHQCVQLRTMSQHRYSLALLCHGRAVSLLVMSVSAGAPGRLISGTYVAFVPR